MNCRCDDVAAAAGQAVRIAVESAEDLYTTYLVTRKRREREDEAKKAFWNFFDRGLGEEQPILR